MIKKIALVGNPNSGKTTFFNKITGASEYSGNRTGVTVKECLRKIKGSDIILCDLPGIYSLSGYAADERRAVSFLTSDTTMGVINIVDGTNLQRGLYLSLQLLKLNLPMIIAINMKDECDKRKIKIDINGLSEELGVKVCFISSRTKEGIQSLINGLKTIKRADINSYDRLMKKLSKMREKTDYPSNEISLANSLYEYSDELFLKYVRKEKTKKNFFCEADKILVNKYLAFPCMFLILGGIFYITFGPFGLLLNYYFNIAFEILSKPVIILSEYMGDILGNMLTQGVLQGLSSIVSYLPQLLCLFILISAIEDSGYMSRICWISDKFMRKFGLSGNSVIPLFLGLGCTTPAIMSTRIIKSKKERNKTIMLTPFMPCSAKIPVLFMLGNIFFKNRSGVVVGAVYLISILSLFFIGYITNRKKDNEFFMLELPPYRIPSIKAIFKMTLKKLKEFIYRAGTVILSVSVIMWFLNNFDFYLRPTLTDGSILSQLGKMLAPVFSPLGFGRREAVAALISGLAAKESIAATLLVVSGGSANLTAVFTPASVVSFMCFASLYLPCFSAFATLVKETDSKKWVVFSVFLHTIYAYGISYVVYRLLA